jgi:CO/xanthine dehydrogenase Mo-binding subunit
MLEATFVTETMMNHVAKVLNKTPDEVRQINFYKQGQVLWKRLMFKTVENMIT